MSVLTWLAGMALGTGRFRLEELGVRELTETGEVDEVLASPGPMLVFKHSTACPVSASAYRRLAEYLREEGASAPPVVLVKVIESRPVSNAFADLLGVTHQSPQIVLVKAGRALWQASHGGIDGKAIRAALARAAG